jgi:pimeloyl-ACP methyl ester carboxylesterase
MNWSSSKSTTKIPVVLVALIAIIITLPQISIAKDYKAELVQLNTRDDVTQAFVYLTPEKPVASVILFSGLFGNIGVKGKVNKPKIKKGGSFLVKNRELFVKHGFTVAVVDAPSDQKKINQKGSKTGMGLDFRLSDEHMQDLKAVIAYLKKAHPNHPIFLAGQSLGTLSVVTAGRKLTDEIECINMTSSANKPKQRLFERWPIYKNYPNAILDFEDLDKVTVPVLVVAHEKDTCPPTPPQNASKLKNLFVNSSDSQLLTYTKGWAKGDCSHQGYHSYYGIQKQVVADIADFMKKHTSK